jgi:hypothetical protein
MTVSVLGLIFATAGANADIFQVAPPAASADRGTYGSITLDYQSIAGGTLAIAGGTRPAGHIVYEVVSGPNPGSNFRTFCVELQQNVQDGPTEYTIVDLTDARTPGPSLTQAQVDEISSVVANAVALGWIGGNLQADTTQTNYAGRMGAIQAAIWDAIDAGVDINDPATDDSIRKAYGTLLDGSTFDSSLRLAGLLALASDTAQDMLYVVPLPPAAFAGMGLLGACLGVRTMRRR